jgi:5'-nucleotidase
MAEPLKDKCLLPRRTVLVGVIVGLAVLFGVILGISIPLANKESPTDDTYPAAKFNPSDDEVLTTVPEPICFSFIPIMSNISDVCTDPLDLPQGGPVCQLIADGLLSASDPDANIDIVLFNGGGVRADILPGDLTAGYIRKELLPFTNNRVAYLSVTPSEIYDTLQAALFDTGFIISEQQQRIFFGENPTVNLSWPYESTYPYAAGLRFDVDLNAPEGDKATNVRIRASPKLRESLGVGSAVTMEEDGSGGEVSNTEIESEWIVLDPTDDTTLIRVLTSDFLAGGGDGFFHTVPKERTEIVDSLGVTQLFAYYRSLQSELIGPAEMSTQHFVPLEGYEEGYQPQ